MDHKWIWTAVFTIVSAVLVLLANVAGVVWDFQAFPYVTPGKVAHYYINYVDFGFVKRGMVGTLLQATGGAPGVWLVRYIALGMGIAVCFLASRFLSALKKPAGNAGFFLLAAFILFNPATFANMGYDLGRFDQLLITCSLGTLYFISKNNPWPAAIISVLALLIHELYILVFFPILLYVAVFHSGFGRKQVLALVLPVAAAALLLFLFGKIEGQSVEQIAETFAAVEGFNFSNYGIIWKRTLESNIRYTLSYISRYESHIILKLSVGALYTLLVYLLLAMITTYNKLDWRGFVVILAASLPLFFIAIDYSRWYALIIINGLLYFGYLVLKERPDSFAITRMHIYGLVLMIILGMLLGPLGVIQSFPLTYLPF